MKYKNILVLMVIAVLGLPLSVQAVVVAGDTLNLYGKMHVSVLTADADTGASGSKNISISSNSSRIGFKGQHDMGNGISVVWQVETEARLDVTGETFAARNSYAGMEGDFGRIILGHHDTPFKLTLAKWAAFRSTIGDARAVFGSTGGVSKGLYPEGVPKGFSIGNKLDKRGKNALMYSKDFGAISLLAMYASDAANSASGAVDNNDEDMTSINVMYQEGPLWLSISRESWSNLDTDGVDVSIGKIAALRIATKYNVNAELKIGFLYESITSDDTAYMQRKAMGINARYQYAGYSFRLQLIQAGDYKGTSSSGATATTFGAFHKYDKQTEVYVVYTAVSNDNNAAFQGIDGGHGDELKTVAGGMPSALALGMIYTF